MSAYYRNKNKREPLIKIGSKYENIEYSSKNIDPNLNHLNRQLYAEESLSKARKQRQLEEYSYYAKALENTKPPVDPYANRLNNNILTGKIGQEQKEVDYQRYQQSKSKVESKAFARVPSSTQRRDMRDMNYHGYNIINNNILGFCDPMQKFPTSSYKQTYQGKGLQKEISEMTPSQYEDYQKFRKEQLEIMEQQKRLQQRGQMQQEKDMERTQVDVNAEMEEKRRVMEKKLQMEREYMEKKRQLEMEQRQMDQMQRNYQGQNTYAQAQMKAQAQGNGGYEYEEGMQRQYEQQQQQRVMSGEGEQMNNAMQGGLTEEQMRECQREYEKYLEQQQREGKANEQQVRDSERDVQQQQQGVMERQPQLEGTGNVNDNQPQVNMNALSEQERAKIEEENYRRAYEAYLLEQERAYQQQQQQQQQPPLKENPNLERLIPQEYPQQQQLPPQQEQQPSQEPSNRISDEEYMRYIEYMNQKEAEERYMKQQQQQLQQQQLQQQQPQYDENEQYQHYLRNNPYQPQQQHPPQSDPQQDLEYLQRLKQYEDIVQDNQPQQPQQQPLPPQTHSPYAPIAVTPSRAQMNYHNARQKAIQGTVATPGKVTKQNFIHGNPCKSHTYHNNI